MTAERLHWWGMRATFPYAPNGYGYVYGYRYKLVLRVLP